MPSFRFCQVVVVSLLAGILCTKHTFALTVCFGDCPDPVQQPFTVLHNLSTGNVFLRDVDGLLEMEPFSISLSATNDLLNPEEAYSIPFAGEPLVDSYPVLDDLDGDGVMATYVTMTWYFPALDRPAFEQPVNVGRIVAPGVGLDSVRFYSRSLNLLSTNARPEILLIPEPSTCLLATLTLCFVGRRRQ